jgi:hypothetical protein
MADQTESLSTGPGEVPYKLKDYHELAKRLMAIADKAQIEEAARVLAVHVGHYQRRYGKVPMEETLAALHTDTPNDAQLAATTEGMQCLIAVLMLATGIADKDGGTA